MQLNYAELDAFFKHTQDTDTLVLTPNRRLVQFLQVQFAHYQRSRGLKAWPGYPCFFIHDWLENLWQQRSLNQPTKILMTKSQEVAIWIQAIRACHSNDVLFNVEATVEVARRAWYNLCQWRLADTSIDIPLFNQWLGNYRSFCARKALIDLPVMIQLVMDGIAEGQFDLPKRLSLFAFDDINPQLRALFAVIESQRVQLEHASISLTQSSAARVLLDDDDAEIATAASWAAEIVSRQTSAAAKQATVGIVIPGLSQQRDRVERIFNQVFEPQSLLPDTPRHASGFNISVGVPLSSTAPVASALIALQLNRRELTIGQVSQLLLSPFVGLTDELPARAVLDTQLRKRYLQLSLDYLCTALAEWGVDDDDNSGSLIDLHRRLQNLQQLIPPAAENAAGFRQAPSQWAQLFSQQLEVLGWPGSRSLDTIEFQQLDLWRKVLLRLGGFDAVFTHVTFNHAFELLQRLAFDTQFQPQTGDSPVQLLGLFEAAGMLFDYLWVMHLDNESWPPPINPNSLLPLHLQKTKQMPMASIERELLIAKQLTERLRRSASHVIFSHSARKGDVLLHPSPLIEHLPTMTMTDLPRYQAASYWQIIADASELEPFVDNFGPLLVDKNVIRGGVQILKDQAACPFRAFATHRLQAMPIVDAQSGLTAAERGNLMHHALEDIWRQLGSHQGLIQLSEDSLRSVINHAVSCSFDRVSVGRTIGPKLKQLEINRLRQLLQIWMEMEKQRSPFTVKSREAKGLITLAELPIRIRYDRIDQLDDGGLCVIDYKTAKTAIRDWAGPRPDEPQVPLYAIAHQQQVVAVAFGQIHIDQVAFKGISDREDRIPGLQIPTTLDRLELPSEWPEILDHWRQALTVLAKEFVTGYAEVKPKYKILSCRYCSLHSLCRVKQYDGIKGDIDEQKLNRETD